MTTKIHQLAKFGGLPIRLAEGLICGWCALVCDNRELWIGKRMDLPDAIRKFTDATAVLCHTAPGELRALIEARAA